MIDYWCQICGAIQHIAQGQTLPICCGTLMAPKAKEPEPAEPAKPKWTPNPFYDSHHGAW